ncbi:type I-F CRISPR-associated protein Csy1 [Vibrio quintilis]|uniref:CRISPR-associated protein Csy1 n=1 Tax=Vibrio quintilis TaxID=1117707 RepID=A0A1M7YXA7_9VIBR|nr:type I-F CRISPR-associated protein Csy1 [Vibrio quintilis]SHO57297.1 CRISPR-associated protein Csy1 [Vibrio quintilis]
MISDQIRAYIQSRFEAKRDTEDKAFDKKRSAATSPSDLDAVEAAYTEKIARLIHDYTPAVWLDSAAKRAKQISMATHVIKLVNSSAKGTSLIAGESRHDPHYLDTSALENPVKDVSGNAASLDVAGLLQLTEDSGKSLLNYLQANDFSPLAPFTVDETQLQSWGQGLKQALEDQAPASHTLGKQVYFPVADGTYHLLAVLPSSALIQTIDETIQHCRFSQAMKEARDAKKANHLYPDPVVTYPNLALMTAGGSKPQNISQLNSQRRGRCYLLPATPPKLREKLLPPLHVESLFHHGAVLTATRPIIKEMVTHLKEMHQNNVDSTLPHRDKIRDYIDQTIDAISGIVGQWQRLPAGWSDEAETLWPEHKRWADPNHPEWDIHDKSWHKALPKQFAQWLNDVLNGYSAKSFLFAGGDQSYWKKFFKQWRDQFRFDSFTGLSIASDAEPDEAEQQQSQTAPKQTSNSYANSSNANSTQGNTGETYLVLKRIQVTQANAVGGLTYGFPAITHFLGYVHALSRKLSAAHGITLSATSVVCHHHQIHAYRAAGYEPYIFAQTRNPLTHEGKTAPINEEGKMNMTVSLVIRAQGLNLINDEQHRDQCKAIQQLAERHRLAGGKITSIDGCYITTHHEPVKVFRPLMPGTILVDRAPLLATEAPDPTQTLKRWLKVSSLTYVSKQVPVKENSEETQIDWQQIDKNKGWLVPFMVGYKQISPLYPAGEVANMRDLNTPVSFVEPIHSIAEWIRRPSRIETLGSVMWCYHDDAPFYACRSEQAQTLSSDDLIDII